MSRRFVFRLQKVLEWTRLKERAKQLEVRALQTRVAEARARLAECAIRVRELLRPREEVALWQLHTEAVPRLQARHHQAASDLVSLEETLARARSRLGDLYRRRKGLESIRDKRAQAFRAKFNQRERKQLDEVALRIRS